MVVVTAGTGVTHKVLLIPGKRTPGSFNRPVSVVLPSNSNSHSNSSSDSDSNSSTGPPLRKRQRLTHLSPEEKALRRKLKNRVAAQTARDRKKAKMGDLEQQVLELELENHKLHIENGLLREQSSGLLTENEELRQRLGLDTLESKESVQVSVSSGDDTGLGIGSSESAALRLHDESDLLLGILDILDPELFLKSCEQECAEPQMLLVDGGHPLPASPPPALGAAPVKLEAINELIHFDHIYTRPVEAEEEEEEEDEEDEDDDDEEECDVQKCDDMEGDSAVKIEAPAYRTADYDDEAATDADAEMEPETVYVKDEPEEVVIPQQADDFLTATSSPALGGLDKEAYLADAYSDSGYERSPSPLSDISSSPLCSESSWDDVFANELFPQLFSV
ncbi:hypothetical protein NHX12_028970 [Muraenolepis orangiensis]|uniref:X-box-binding protein 1 n=1 Tax=Muraenolepis orangiensis TaxID=630683 RepID=A0A9Q0ECT5_9TELE|nr:hypothetical protein NHX12_028970 [Muraenolepis orangiensis]